MVATTPKSALISGWISKRRISWRLCAPIPGYLDITPGDFKEIYLLAFQQALERLRRDVNAAEIMTRDVVTVNLDTPVADVAAAMGRRGISGLPVVDVENKVLGIISEKDFLARMGVTEPQNFMSLVAGCLKTKGCVALPIKKALAGDIMSAPAVTVAPQRWCGPLPPR